MIEYPVVDMFPVASSAYIITITKPHKDVLFLIAIFEAKNVVLLSCKNIKSPAIIHSLYNIPIASFFDKLNS